MPTYEYRCGDCGHREEHMHSIQNVYNPRCEKCGRWMRMVYSPAAVVYKGEGFAKKDRAKKEGR